MKMLKNVSENLLRGRLSRVFVGILNVREEDLRLLIIKGFW